MTKLSQKSTAKANKANTEPFIPYPAPDFALPCSDGTVVASHDLRGSWVVLFLYPADNTPTCTTEACDFSTAAPEFAALGVRLYGLSADDLKSHDKFIRKYGLAMPLLSDEDHAVITAFGSWIEKSMYGKTYMGIDRSTFIIDPDGVVQRVWRGIRVKNHVNEVLEAIKSLRG